MRTSDTGVSARSPCYAHTFAGSVLKTAAPQELQQGQHSRGSESGKSAASSHLNSPGKPSTTPSWPPISPWHLGSCPGATKPTLAAHLLGFVAPSLSGQQAGGRDSCASPAWGEGGQWQVEQSRRLLVHLTGGEDTGFKCTQLVIGRPCGRNAAPHASARKDPLSHGCRSFGSRPLAPCLSPRHSWLLASCVRNQYRVRSTPQVSPSSHPILRQAPTDPQSAVAEGSSSPNSTMACPCEVTI